jgi:small conductance mechanosensitive channel
MQSILSMVDSFLSYASSIVGLVWCLSAIGINLSTIFASIGIVALVIGFAAESLISDIITGIFLVFEDDFNVGDIVELNGFRGTVSSIGVRVTCIRDGGGNLKIINNSDLRDILNRSKASSLAVCDAPVSYNANLEEVEKILEKILAELPEKYPDTFLTTPVYLGVQALSASSVDLRVCAEVSEENLFSATRIMNREIKVGFDKAGVEIPYQQLVVRKAEG